MKQYWITARNRIDDMSLRERAMIFLAAAAVLVALINTLLLDPQLAKQKALSTQVIQQQEKMKALQASIQSLIDARQQEEHSPLRVRSSEIRQQLRELDDYLLTRSSRLVEPENMADLLRQVLAKNGKLQLVELKTLPASPLIEKSGKPDAAKQVNATQGATSTAVESGTQTSSKQKQIFKHGVQISVRGGYLELMNYVSMLEKLPAQMFWGEASLSVEKYPYSVLTLTLYTLSLDKTWLTV
jgi:MSHA biogenesis protein MshJ